MQCWSAHAVSLRDACKPLQAFMAVNVAAPRSSVKMCEKPARRHPTTDSGASSAHIIRPLRDPVAADQEQASLSAWRMIAANLVIRHPRADERADWEPLWKGYQAFYKVVISDETTTATWARLHDPDEPMGILGAYVDARLCGIAHYLFHRSCWTVGDYCYLQDLFVAENARHLGLGRALIAAVEERARRAGASRLYWLTHESNASARALYDKLAERSGFIQYRKLF